MNFSRCFYTTKILPYWDDLVTWNPANYPIGTGSIYYQTLGTAPNRIFVVEWNNNQHFDYSTDGVTFEAVLYEGSNNIKFQYKHTLFGTVTGSTTGNMPYDNGAHSTVGIEGPTGPGLQYSYNEPVIDAGLAIMFNSPLVSGTNPNLVLTKNAPVSMDHGQNMVYTLNYFNQNPAPAPNVVLEDSLDPNVNFISASGGGVYDAATRKVTWNIGMVNAASPFPTPLPGGQMTISVSIPSTVPVGTVIHNTAQISTTSTETRLDDNVASASTTITGSNLPQDVSISPTNGNTGGTPSIYYNTPVTFSYHSSSTATGVNIKIHVNDNGPDITGSMTGGPPDWTYSTTLYPRHGAATVTYTVQGESCQAATTLPDGLHLPTSSGLIGLEQHLYNNVPGDGYVPPGSLSTTGLAGSGGRTSYTNNGYAGRGAFAPHPSDLSEKYYINMRWPDGRTWYNDGTGNTYDPTTYLKYAHKKVLITAPATGKGVIASIEESGPAPWTGKDAGSTPEAFVDLGFYPRGDGQTDPHDYTLNYQWADQNSQLGPCTPSISFNIYIDPAGFIYDTATGARISGASVWLQRPDGLGGWQNVSTGQTPPIMQPDVNPLITGADGQYQWDVLNGTYRVHVEAPNYYSQDSIAVNIPPPVTDLHVGLLRIPGSDSIPPTTNLTLSGTLGNNSWYISDVQVNLTATDNAGSSGVNNTEYSFDNATWNIYTAPFNINTEGVTTLYYYSTDNAGNVESTKTQTIKIDKTSPIITGDATTLPNSNGWYNTNVVVHFNASDNISGIDTVTPDVILSTEGVNLSVTGTATDIAGNSNSTTISGINIDKTPPQIVINTPANGSNYILNQTVFANWSVNDSLSGIASATATTSNGKAIDTATVGNKTFSVNGTDNAGNQANQTVTYNVVYNYSGFFPPFKDYGSNDFKLGSTIPVKFQLWDVNGNNITTAIACIYLTNITNGAIGKEINGTSTSNATTGNLFRYDNTSNQYIFNLATKPLSAETWRIRISLDDGTSKYATMGLK